MRCIGFVTLCVAAAALAACGGPASTIVSAPSVAGRDAHLALARATGRTLPRARALYFETAQEAQRAATENGGPCGMLDSFPRSRSPKEAAFVASYRRALDAHGDCPLIWKRTDKRRVSSIRATRDDGCWDWWTNDPNGPADGQYHEIYGGGDDSGCSDGSGGFSGGSDYGGPTGSGGGGGGGGTTTNPYPFNAVIAAAANAAYGTSDVGRKPAGVSCAVACVYTVNNIVHDATGEYLCGPGLATTDQVKSCAQTALVSQATSRAGDFIIVDSLNGKDAHIGICLNTGCTQMNSNSSTNCTFTFNNPKFDYPGSPYHNGYVTYWRMIS